MIYVSSSCVKKKSIVSVIETLAKKGIKNIELSGGSQYEQGTLETLQALRKKLNLNFRLHNYFPAPKDEFILNLASEEAHTFRQSYEHLEKAIRWSASLGAKRYAFHAGFYIPITIHDIGKKIPRSKLQDVQTSQERFYSAYRKLEKLALSLGVELYIENNVYSHSNYEVFNDEVPFMLLSSRDYLEMKERINFRVLLDIAHLKVSCKTLGLDFKKELDFFLPVTDYIHLSANDGLHDTNKAIHKDKSLMKLLRGYDLKNKTFTLEIYDDLNEVVKSYKLLEEVQNR